MRLSVFTVYLTNIINLGLVQRIFISQNSIVALKKIQLVHRLLLQCFYEVALMISLLAIYNNSGDTTIKYDEI